jgi:hypothetical protein
MLDAQCSMLRPSRKRASKDRFKNKLAGGQDCDTADHHIGRVKDNGKRGVHGVKISDLSGQIEMESR